LVLGMRFNGRLRSTTWQRRRLQITVNYP